MARPQLRHAPVSFFMLLGLAEVIRRVRAAAPSSALRRLTPAVVALTLVWTLHLVVCYRAGIQPHGEPLALHPILTEWRRWARQIYIDSGLRLVVRGRPTVPGGAGP